MILRSFRRLFPAFMAVLVLVSCVVARAQLKEVGDGGAGPVQATHLSVEIVASGKQIAMGGQMQAGLHFVLEEGWHVYWVNAGLAGAPPAVVWTLPAGISAGPMLFPIPSRLPLGPVADYGYEREVTYPIALKAERDAKAGPAHLDAKVSWLVCSTATCIPGKAHLGLDVTVTNGAAEGAVAAPIAAALAHMPQPLPAGAKVTANASARDLVVTLNDGKGAAHAEFYPFDTDALCYANDEVSAAAGQGVRVWDERALADTSDCSAKDAKVTAAPKTIHGLLKLSDAVAYEFTAPVTAAEVARPVGAVVASGPAVSTPRTAGNSGGELTALSAVGLAFVGGILLNLMPCVFPVLFLKGLALVNSSNEERGRQQRHGLVYALGILVSFWVVVAVLLVLRAGGSQFGWGFQLQSPTFVALLSAFLFLFALSLAGQFDIGLSLTSVGGELAQKQGYAGSFFTGVLATVVATPCTAPLMGAAVGFALAQPAWLTFVIFTALALGLALPYVLLSAQPAWVRLLPKPGAWMELLKQFTSLMLFGTAIAGVWIYGSLFAADGDAVDRMARMLWCFLLLAVAGWALGRWPAKRGSTVVAVLLIAAGLAVPLMARETAKQAWTPFSPQALAEARAAGKPVFVDFTAAWCLSCQVNERLVLNTAEVQKALSDGKVTLLKADWTKYDDTITQQLASVNRSGVPTYVVYPAGAQSQPDVLPELLTKSLVLDAIHRDAGH